jgi:hypothetical protein
MDTSAFEAGRYGLAIGEAGWGWFPSQGSFTAIFCDLVAERRGGCLLLYSNDVSVLFNGYQGALAKLEPVKLD